MSHLFLKEADQYSRKYVGILIYKGWSQRFFYSRYMMDHQINRNAKVLKLNLLKRNKQSLIALKHIEYSSKVEELRIKVTQVCSKLLASYRFR